jgi:signal transduction histidine kinase/ActR/RegA family two-component response regulator
MPADSVKQKQYHKILEKQIQHYLQNGGVIDAGLDVFLDGIGKTYTLFERDKLLADHAFAVSEKEYQEVLQNISAQNAIINESIVKLKNAIIELDPESNFKTQGSESEIINIIDFLEKQIIKQKRLEADLVSAKEIAEDASRAKGDFLSVMSHEIRTPLNAIIGLSYVIMTAQDLSPLQQNNMKVLHISAQNLLLLINDILDFNRIEEGKITLTESVVNICDLVKNIKSANNQTALERGNKIKLMVDQDIPQHIISDELRLNQIINNLVSNAIKFTSNGLINFEIALVNQTPNTVEILFSVQDTGIGIPKDKLGIIFDHFTQADGNITRSFGGSGLGLAIVKKLLKLFNAEIQVESEPGKGSRFYFTIEFEKSDAASHKKQSGDSAEQLMDFSGKKILLVEDVEFNILFTEQILKTWGIATDIANNGQEAVYKVRENEYDVVLMDIRMPVMDGFTATGEIRKFNQRVPIVALTASASAELLEKIKDQGFNDYVLKPFAPKDLNKAISRGLDIK